MNGGATFGRLRCEIIPLTCAVKRIDRFTAFRFGLWITSRMWILQVIWVRMMRTLTLNTSILPMILITIHVFFFILSELVTYNADSSRYLHRLSISEKVSDITDPVFVMTSRYNVESVRTSILYRQWDSEEYGCDSRFILVIHDAEEYFQPQSNYPESYDNEIPIISHSGCAWSVSYQVVSSASS